MQTKSKYSFFVWIIKDWNNLPNHLYVNKFKIGYKKVEQTLIDIIAHILTVYILTVRLF